jgi:hypothetical protein
LSGNAISFNGFNNIPEKFKNYFFTDGSSQTQLSQYLEKYSVFSPFQNVRESFENIDFDVYKIRVIMYPIDADKKYDLSIKQRTSKGEVNG